MARQDMSPWILRNLVFELVHDFMDQQMKWWNLVRNSVAMASRPVGKGHFPIYRDVFTYTENTQWMGRHVNRVTP